MVEHFSGFETDQAQAEFFGATAETVNEAGAVVLLVGGRAGVVLDDVAAQDAVNE